MPLRAAWRGYAALLARHPYLTSSATGGTVMLSGDALAQRFEQRQQQQRQQQQQQQQQRHPHAGGTDARGYDPVRAAVMVGFSVGAFMPVNTLWYRNVVERVLPDVAKHRTPFPPGALTPRSLPFLCGRTFAKAVFGCSPALVLNPIFFLWAPTAEAVLPTLIGQQSRPIDWEAVSARISQRFEQDMCTVVANSYSLWVPINCLNFVFTPPQFRIITIAIVSNFWNCYLSLVQHK